MAEALIGAAEINAKQELSKNKTMTYYFAHPISIYNTRKEGVLMDMISRTTFLSNPCILNPNSEYHECQYKLKGMDYFLELVDECDALIIYPFEDNTIGAGIVKEALRAIDKGKRVYQIDAKTFDMEEIFVLKNCLTVDETRAKLKNIKLQNT